MCYNLFTEVKKMQKTTDNLDFLDIADIIINKK